MNTICRGNVSISKSLAVLRKTIVAYNSDYTGAGGPLNSNFNQITMSNLLKNELSPYLLQHQHNPVHWHPWNPSTLEKAKRENKPIFLSSGYSTCHWCHVMERESFENPRIAEIMNTHFINIKLDREERPDLDRIYMTFVQAVTGSGGWPMSVWMTPDLLPFYGGTYYPPEDRYFGRPGFKALLQTLAEQWEENPDKCLESSVKINEVMKKNASLAVSTSFPSDAGKKCLNQLTRSFEPAFGGFSEQPKFPQPANLQFLIHYSKTEPDCMKMVEKQLKMMRKGGIYDHLGLGCSRYSTDKKWHVPHFEKMLYDQAQLTIVYLKTFLITKNQFYSDVAQEILSYVSRDMSTEDGGFFSAEDADSLPTKDSTHKKEGAFYVWEKVEIENVLGNINLPNGTPLSALFCERYGVKENGNVDPYQDPHDELKKKNVLFEAKDLDSLAKEFSLSVSEVESSLNTARQKLLEFRNATRPRPHLDNKFIASWNGLMLSAFAQAGFILSNPAYIKRAKESAQFIEDHLIVDGDLLRTCYFKDSNIVNLATPIKGCVDDFSNVIAGMLDTFQCTGEPKYLEIALKLQVKQDELFWDEKDGGYFNSRANDSSVIVLMKDDDDGAEPSSNSTSVINLLRLSSIADSKFRSKVSKLLYQFSDRMEKIPITLPLMTSALLSHVHGVPRVTIVGKDINQNELYKKLTMKLLPVGSLVIPVDTEKDLTALKTVIPELPDVSSDGAFIKIGDTEEKKETNLDSVW